ncbi:MAG: hypothetical protein E7286_07560 [Lachnospiraceae bacterium]|nr:hypothetical protein [Lachnospiraceae bacterium]
MREIIENWEDIKNTVKEENCISDVSFKIWIEPMRIAEIRRDCLYVLLMAEANQKNIEAYVTRKYRVPFEKVVETYCGTTMDVRFIVRKGSEMSE